MASFLLHNCLAFDPRSGKRIEDALVHVAGGVIQSVASGRLPEGGELPTVDCEGGFLMPAFHDAHTHTWMGGEFLDYLDASDLDHKDDLLERIAAQAARVRQRGGPDQRSGWVLGYGVHVTRYKPLPTAEEIRDAAQGTPVYIDTNDLHSVLVDSDLLKRAGIDASTPDPPGGSIDRDAAGNPTGLLRENAAGLVSSLKPAPTTEEIKAGILRAQEHAFSLGVTATDENIRLNLFPAYRELVQEGRLKLAIHGWLIDMKNLGESVFGYDPIDEPRFRMDTLKLFSDGALGSSTAAIHGRYLSGGQGTLVAEIPVMEAFMRRGAEAGWRLAVHAIGDRAVREMLDIYERMDRDGLPVKGRRHRIEHAQMVRREDIPRFAELGILPSLQPVHCAGDQDGFEARFTREDQLLNFIWGSFDRLGLCLPLGSDWPVEKLDPRLTLYYGSTQLSYGGLKLLDPQEALGVDRLLRGLTTDAAEAACWEDRRGSLAAGMDADLVLLGADPAALKPEQLLSLPIRRTWAAGEEVYRA